MTLKFNLYSFVILKAEGMNHKRGKLIFITLSLYLIVFVIKNKIYYVFLNFCGIFAVEFFVIEIAEKDNQ